MLNIIIDSITNKVEGEITGPSGYFDANYEQDWFKSDLAREIVKGIDNTTYVSGEYFESPVLGAISPRDLSTGCKATLLLLNENNIIIRGERFGDNCAEWILKLAEEKDITITMNHYIKFPQPFKIKCLNTNKILTNRIELIEEINYVGQSEGGYKYDRDISKVEEI